MKNNNKMVYSILDIIGGILLLLALVLNTMELASTILIGLLAIIGFVLCLPDNIVFLKRKINENAELGCYWVVKFLATLLGNILVNVFCTLFQSWFIGKFCFTVEYEGITGSNIFDGFNGNVILENK